MNGDYTKQIDSLREDIHDIRKNHLAHIEVDIAKISTNQDWIMRFFWIFMTPTVGGIVVLLLRG